MKLELKNITKSFSGTQILKDISFTIQSGRALGFLGRNGAGKTTTIRALMNVFKPDSGYFHLDGKEIDRNKYKFGYLPEERGMYQEVKIIDQLVYFGELRGLTKKEAKERAKELLEKVELSEYENKKLKVLSKGNQQKIQIIQSIIHDPDIVIFDEPFSGLDPVNAQSLKNIISEYISRDKIVLFSSHQMSLVEEFCDDVVFIKQGEIKLFGNLEEIKVEKGKDKYIIKTNTSDALSLLKNLPNIKHVKELKNGIFIETEKNSDINELLKNIIDSRIEINSFVPYRISLEDLFIELDKED